jgi:hypothetical protein
VEGHINRLKLLTRQMFGRARLDLLARRFLLTACSGTAHPSCWARVYARMASSTLITKTGQPPV